MTAPAMSPKQIRSIAEADTRVSLWSGAVRSGKAQPLDAKVLTPTGFRPMGEIAIGTRVCNPDGTTAKVIGVYDRGPMQLYRVTLADGSSTEVAGDHLWAVAIAQRRRRGRSAMPVIPPGMRPEDEWNARVMSRCRVLSTDEMREILARGRENLLLPFTNPTSGACGTNQWPRLSPYTLGALLGDGHFSDCGAISLTTADPEVVDRVAAELPEHLHFGRTDPAGGRSTTYHLTRRGGSGEYASAYIKREGLAGTRSWDKFVPDRVFRMNPEDRFAFVQGLMDTDGSISEMGHAEFVSCSERLASGLQQVLRSLGFKATLSTKETSFTYQGEKKTGRRAYRLYIQGRDMGRLFSLPRKAERARKYLGNDNIEPMHRVVSIEPTRIAEARCIEVDHLNHLYVTDDYIVTHNTISSILRWFMFLASPPKQGGHFVMVGRTRDSIARNVIDVMQNEQLFGKLAGEVTYRTGQPFATILGRKVWVLGAHDNQAEKTLRGLTVAGAYVDEATVIQQDFFKQLLARMSVDGAQLFATTNPDNPMHWLKSEFIDRIGTGPGQLKDWRTWHFTLDDNPRLSEAYKDSLKAEYTGLWYRRFIQGEWVSAEGAVFDMWDPARHIVAWEKLPRMEELVCMGVDYGTTNPTVAVILGRGEDNVMYVVDEWSHEAKESEQRWTDAELSKAIRRFHRSRHLPEYGDKFERTEDPVEITVVDPAAASLRVQLQQDGMHSYTANNDLGYGVPLLGSLFSRGRLKISSRCVRLAREIPGYSWDPKATEKGQDIPIKANDHAIDATRYALVSTEGRWRPAIDRAAIDISKQPA